jgi:hypothetical protein
MEWVTADTTSWFEMRLTGQVQRDVVQDRCGERRLPQIHTVERLDRPPQCHNLGLGSGFDRPRMQTQAAQCSGKQARSEDPAGPATSPPALQARDCRVSQRLRTIFQRAEAGLTSLDRAGSLPRPRAASPVS